jgi:hypothetical protein
MTVPRMKLRMVCTVRATQEARRQMIKDANGTIGGVLRFHWVPKPVSRKLFCRGREPAPANMALSSWELLRLPLDRQEYRLSAMLGELVFVYEGPRGA